MPRKYINIKIVELYLSHVTTMLVGYMHAKRIGKSR